MPEIAKLEPVDLRMVWENEADDFTPWLAKNLDRLGEALGMDLKLVRPEAPVGPFSLDILAKDDNDDRKVVIENQLERTDHNHLGQVITYAAGNDADVMVWVVKDFRDEHRQALDWLNQRTSEETEFWGVVVRAVRIGDSSPAAVFEIVSRPNTVIKSRVVSGQSGDPSPKGQAYLAFWPRVLDRLRDEHKLTSKRSSTTKSWMGFASGIHGVGCNVSFSAQGARVELYLDKGRGYEELTKHLFDILHGQRERIEEAFGEELTWERLDHARASRIALYLANRSSDDPEDVLADTANWMVDKYIKLVKRVVPIDELDADLRSEEAAEE